MANDFTVYLPFLQKKILNTLLPPKIETKEVAQPHSILKRVKTMLTDLSLE